MEVVVELVRQQRFEIDEDSGKEAPVIGGNGDFYVEPMGQRCRGRLVKAIQPKDQADGKMFNALPETLPGYCISIDVQARKVKVYDPLHGTQKGEDLARRFEGIGQSLRLKKPFEYSGLGDQQLWTWLKWTFRAVRDGHAEIQRGKFPEVVGARVEQERQWALQADPDNGKRPWEPEPALEDGAPTGKQPQKNAA